MEIAMKRKLIFVGIGIYLIIAVYVVFTKNQVRPNDENRKGVSDSTILDNNKIPLRLPFGLSPYLSADSTNIILRGKGATNHYTDLPGKPLPDVMDFKMNLGPAIVKTLIPETYHKQLYGMGMISGYLDEPSEQLLRIKDIINFIENTYSFKDTIDKVSDVNKGADLVNKLIYEAQSDSFIIDLYSGYDAGDGFRASVYFRYIPLLQTKMTQDIIDKKIKEEESKKDL
jgi:hypothetical protein